MPSLDVISAVKKIADIDISDKSGGIVTFDRQCYIDYDKDLILRSLRRIFKKRYPHIKIKSLTVKALNSFPQDFKNYKFYKIEVSKYALQKNDGTFAVLYKNSDDRTLRVYFRFKIVAKVTVFKAKNNITNGKILTSKDYEKKEVDFDKIPSNILSLDKDGEIVAKTFIKKGKILTSYMVKKKTLIRKKDVVTAVIKSGALKVEFEATALNDANIGDEVRVINSDKKVFKAIAIDKGLVEIR
ncbi:MAG: flagellar basal body P-ring formation protein FlgA [Epsilonproteobacteria bacterium]|nr:flagellar basal body P-ring formation protein FlgA [Campylobacterota bacterium]